MRNEFKTIFSIELDEKLYKKAMRKFQMYDHISIFHGDSPRILYEILSKIKLPCIFWLDAHYSGGETTKGDVETPIMNEIRS